MAMTHERYQELKKLLEERQRASFDEVEKIRQDKKPDPIDLELLRIWNETLDRIDEALKALEAGKYGICSGCGREIRLSYLRAVMFATQCERCSAENSRLAARRARRKNQMPLLAAAE